MRVAQLLTDPTNYAVVQLPERRFPGVVFQGDSLHALITGLEAAIAEPDPEERAVEFDDILQLLRAVRRNYEATLQKAGISLPYVTSFQDI